VAYILWSVGSLRNEKYDTIYTLVSHGENLIKSLGATNAEQLVAQIQEMIDELKVHVTLKGRMFFEFCINFSNQDGDYSKQNTTTSVKSLELDSHFYSHDEFKEKILNLGVMWKIVYFLDGYIMLSESEGIGNFVFLKTRYN
jgi:hypothetical protein